MKILLLRISEFLVFFPCYFSFNFSDVLYEEKNWLKKFLMSRELKGIFCPKTHLKLRTIFQENSSISSFSVLTMILHQKHSGNISYKREVKNIFGGFFNFFGQNCVFKGSERLHTENFVKIPIDKKLGKIR
jgi:hypothetical protein